MFGFENYNPWTAYTEQWMTPGVPGITPSAKDLFNMFTGSNSDQVNQMDSTDANSPVWLSDYFDQVKDYNSAEAVSAFERSQEAVKQQQDWYKMMSDTEIQRRMQDLKAAGLNPVLAAGSLGGASSAMSGAAQTSAASVSTPANANTLTGMLSSSAAVVSALGSVLQYILPKLSSATSQVNSSIRSLSESTNYNYSHIFKG